MGSCNGKVRLIYIFNPPLYKIRKIPIKDILTNELKPTQKYLVRQSDNQMFRQIRLITSDISEYQKYFAFLDCAGYKNRSEELSQVIRNGFTIDDQHFVLSERSQSMQRDVVLGFIDETLINQIDNIVNLGLDIKKCMISKNIAYRGLMLSSCFCIENWLPEFIIVDDFTVTIKNQHVRYLADGYIDYRTGKIVEGKGKHITDGYKDIEIQPWDGLGLCSFEVSKKIKELIGITDESPTSWQIRMPWCKGVIHTIDFTNFWHEHGIREITDIWGKKHSIYNSNLVILTRSMTKCIKYFKSWDDYLQVFYKYNHCFGIAKWNYSLEKEPRFSRCNYQVLQTLDLPYEQFKHIADYSKEWIEKIVFGDPVYTYALLGLFADNLKPQNEYMEAILKNSEMLKDQQIHRYLLGILRKKIDEMKCGKVYIRGSFKIIASDLIMLLQRIAGIESDGILDEDEFWAKSYLGTCKGKYVLNRNPHIASSESVCLYGTSNNKWIKHLDNVVMINAKSITMNRLSGCDMDKLIAVPL